RIRWRPDRFLRGRLETPPPGPLPEAERRRKTVCSPSPLRGGGRGEGLSFSPSPKRRGGRGEGLFDRLLRSQEDAGRPNGAAPARSSRVPSVEKVQQSCTDR